jgi:spore coat protein U-like protein
MPVQPLYIYLILSIFLLPLTAFAQFTDSTHYSVNYATTGSINKTNDGQSYLLNNAAKFGVKKKSFSLNFSNSWVYGKQDRQLTNNDFSSTLDFNLYSSIPHFFYWGLANYNTSRSLQINNQLLAGAGIAYSIYERKNAYLNISDGLLFDSSDLMLTEGVRDVYQTYRNSLRVVFKFVISDFIVLNNSAFFQPSLNRKNDYIFKSDSGLSFKLNKFLSLTTALNYNRVSRTDRENLLFSYGLSFEKFF